MIVSEETGEVSIAKSGKLYTRESGVRSLERVISSLIRKSMASILKKNLNKTASEDKSFFKGGIFK